MMEIRPIDRMLLSRCIQDIGEEIRQGKREVMPPCSSIREFEIWRISFIDRLLADPYDDNEPLKIPYEDLQPDSREYVDKIMQ